MTILSATAIAFAVNILTSISKGWIRPKFGVLGVHIVMFALAVIGALYVVYGGSYPSITRGVEAGLIIFSMAVTFYEVLLKRIALFKQ